MKQNESKTQKFPILRDRKTTAILLIDVQNKTTDGFIPRPKRLLAYIDVLLECASILNLPILVAEHHLPNEPDPTHDSLQPSLKKCTHFIFNKKSWSMVSQEVLDKLAELNTKNLILCGIDTHLCVLNTAIDLLQHNYNVFICEDATRSERERDRQLGLKRLSQIGCYSTSVEACIYEIIQECNEEFIACRKVMNRLKDKNFSDEDLQF